MKRKKINYFAAIAFPILTGILLLSYGNTKNHPTLNAFMVDSFLKKQEKNESSMAKFKNYDFDFDKPRLKGDYITKAGLFNPSEIDNWKGDQLSNFEFVGINSTYTEESREVSPKKWIEHGGFSADVPEVPASFRHFYDPTQKEGERYLSDKVNSKIMSLFQSQFKNPKTDGLEWALGTKGDFGVLEHSYTWEHGKKYMKAAWEEINPDKRKNYMAKAWRSLGETLHMIADHGCPPHVRNDGHPSIPIPLMSYFGNYDPYEEYLDIWQNKNADYLNDFKNGSVPKEESERFKNAKTAREIAHELAVFTNKNFFTNETISGTDWKGNTVKQITHPEYEYASPKLNGTDYSKNYYRKNIAGQEVLLCTDTWFFSKYPISKTKPYIDEACVISQAKILVPTIADAGANVIKLFIPQLEVKINSLDENGTISGTIMHTTDNEYKEKINYKGPVTIKTTTFETLATLQATNGKFTGKISGGNGENIIAEIECGGIKVKSKSIKKTQKQTPVKKETYDFFNIEFGIAVHTTYTDGFKDNDQTFYVSDWRSYDSPWLGGGFDGFKIGKGNSFSGKLDLDHVDGWIEGERNDQKIVWLKAHIHETWRTGDYTTSASQRKVYREQWLDIELKDIPVDETFTGEYQIEYDRYGWDCNNQRPYPEFKKSLVKLEHRVKFYPSNKEISISSINYSKSEVRKCEDKINNFFLREPGITVQVRYNNNY